MIKRNTNTFNQVPPWWELNLKIQTIKLLWSISQFLDCKVKLMKNLFLKKSWQIRIHLFIQLIILIRKRLSSKNHLLILEQMLSWIQMILTFHNLNHQLNLTPNLKRLWMNRIKLIKNKILKTYCATLKSNLKCNPKLQKITTVAILINLAFQIMEQLLIRI